MAWRMLMRRIPNRWMTIIGDTAQTGDLAGTRSWQDVLEPYVAKRWQLRELTVNYRTPAEITRYANRVLHHINPEHSPPTSLRSNGIEPYAVMGSPLAAAVVGALGDWPGLTAVIAPDDECAPIIAALDTGVAATADVRVLTVTACKGLEFDNVVVVEPAAILRQSPRGHSDLYVALTRATQRLVVVHDEPLCEELSDLP